MKADKKQVIVFSLILGLWPARAFASLLLRYGLSVYRQKNPLKYHNLLSLLG